MAITVTASNLVDTQNGFSTLLVDPLENMSSDNSNYAAMTISMQGNPIAEKNKHGRLTAIFTCKDNLGNTFADTLMLPTEQVQYPNNGLFYTILLNKSADTSSAIIDTENGMRLEVGTALFGGVGGSISIQLMGKVGYNGALLHIAEIASNGAVYLRRLDQSAGNQFLEMPFVIT